MKKLMTMLLAFCMLLGTTAMADFWMPGISEEDEMVFACIEQLKNYYVKEYDELDYFGGDGHMEIVHTQVIYIKDEITVDEYAAEYAEMFDDMYAIVDFVVLDDFRGTSPYCMPYCPIMSVIQYIDGTMAVMPAGVFPRYSGMSYSNDFSGIIESVSDRNYEFNNTWYLLK